MEPPNSGYWNEDERDESDNEEDVHETLVNGMVISYKASIKTKIKFTMCKSGETRRHVVPNNFKEALSHEDAQLLREACLKKMNAQIDCNTWVERDASEFYAEGRVPINGDSGAVILVRH